MLNSTSTCIQVVDEGYQFYWDRKLVSIFSAPNYCGEFRNNAAIMCVDEHSVCSFVVRWYHDLSLCRSIRHIFFVFFFKIFSPNSKDASYTDQRKSITQPVNRMITNHITWVDIESSVTNEWWLTIWTFCLFDYDD